jgi:hypothetical protein
VLDEKKRLKATVGVLAKRMETNVSEFRELRKTKMKLKYFRNYSNEFQVKKKNISPAKNPTAGPVRDQLSKVSHSLTDSTVT